MDIVRIVLKLLLAGLSIVLCVIILKQEGKSAGLSASIAGGSADTYVQRNKARTPEGRLVRWTKIFIAIFMGAALVINILS